MEKESLGVGILCRSAFRLTIPLQQCVALKYDLHHFKPIPSPKTSALASCFAPSSRSLESSPAREGNVLIYLLTRLAKTFGKVVNNNKINHQLNAPPPLLDAGGSGVGNTTTS